MWYMLIPRRSPRFGDAIVRNFATLIPANCEIFIFGDAATAVMCKTRKVAALSLYQVCRIRYSPTLQLAGSNARLTGREEKEARCEREP